MHSGGAAASGVQVARAATTPRATRSQEPCRRFASAGDPGILEPSCTTSSDRARKWARKSAGLPNRRPPQTAALQASETCLYPAQSARLAGASIQVRSTVFERSHAPYRFLACSAQRERTKAGASVFGASAARSKLSRCSSTGRSTVRDTHRETMLACEPRQRSLDGGRSGGSRGTFACTLMGASRRAFATAARRSPWP
jgi:hypothetical protein